MPRNLQRVLLFVIAAVAIIADQITKDLVRRNLAPLESFAPVPALGGFFTLINTHNTGAAFGMFKQAGGIFTVIAIIVVGAIVYYYPRIPEGQIGIRVALGLQLGGAIGNLIDRLLFGTVTDFIFFHWYDTLHAPIFNLADLAITCGVVVLALLMWRDGREEHKARVAAIPEPATPHD
ncbi:MAG: signal peptidase II [Chloroflexota bacterium]